MNNFINIPEKKRGYEILCTTESLTRLVDEFINKSIVKVGEFGGIPIITSRFISKNKIYLCKDGLPIKVFDIGNNPEVKE